MTYRIRIRYGKHYSEIMGHTPVIEQACHIAMSCANQYRKPAIIERVENVWNLTQAERVAVFSPASTYFSEA